jgi:16S rRNA (guanine527-N7)-methyltransferase
VSDAPHPGRAALGALDQLLADAPALGASLPAAWSAAAATFVDLLLAANEHRNLTRLVEPAAVARDHLLDAIAALPRLDELAPASVVDIGSGGGIPALPLALARPTLRWTLVEATRGKAALLQEAATTLGLSNVEVLAERAEDVGRDPGLREAADVVIARACAPLPVLAELALPLLRVGGTLLAWKGPLTPEDEEIVRGTAASALLGGDRPTIISAGHRALGGRTFVSIGKLRPTDERYPRRAGQPARRPLG